jgi:chemotaxis protein histidine kinase CheA
MGGGGGAICSCIRHIVKRMIEANGGTVSVDSEVGRGTTFRTSLPLAHAPAKT